MQGTVDASYLQGGVPAGSKGAFWQGADNNVWVAGDQGTNSAGVWDQNTANYWTGLGYSQIADPNPPAQTSPATTGYSSTGGTTPALASADAAVRRAVSGSFDATRKGLQGLLNDIPTDRTNATGQVNELYGNNVNSINSARDRGQANIDFNRGQAEQQLKVGQRRIGETGRQAIQAFNNQLGTFGASNSSAAGLGAEAIGRDAQKVRSDLFAAGQERMGQLDLTQGNLDAEYMLQMQDLNTWKNQQITAITSEYDKLQRDIRQQMTVADAEEQLALAQLSQDIANRAASAYQNVMGQVQSVASNISAPTTNTSGLAVSDSYSALSPNLAGIQGGLSVNGSTVGPSFDSFNIQPARKDQSLQGGLGSLLQGGSPVLQGSYNQ